MDVLEFRSYSSVRLVHLQADAASSALPWRSRLGCLLASSTLHSSFNVSPVLSVCIHLVKSALVHLRIFQIDDLQNAAYQHTHAHSA